MRRHKNRFTASAQVGQHFGDNRSSLGVHGIEGFVEEQQVGVLGERPRQQRALLLTAGQVADLPRAQVTQAEVLERLPHNLPVFFARSAQPA